MNIKELPNRHVHRNHKNQISNIVYTIPYKQEYLKLIDTIDKAIMSDSIQKVDVDDNIGGNNESKN